MPIGAHTVRSRPLPVRTFVVMGAVALLSALDSMSALAQGRPALRIVAPAAGAQRAPIADDSVGAVRAVEAFRAALIRGDSAAALVLLAPDVVVIESGDVEHLDDYRRHHLPADIGFARVLPGVHTLVSAHVEGAAAWVTSTSTTQGQFKGRTVNSVGSELIVLTRTGAAASWRIRAIHWSSHRKP